jgi:hypothetical protein
MTSDGNATTPSAVSVLRVTSVSELALRAASTTTSQSRSSAP